MIAYLADGSTLSYGEPLEAASEQKLLDVCISIRDGKPVPCGLEAASAQNICMFAAQASMPDIVKFPTEMIVTSGEVGQRITYVNGLQLALSKCYQSRKLPSELQYDWAKPGKVVPIQSA